MSERFKIVIVDSTFKDANKEQEIVSQIGAKIYKYNIHDEDEVANVTGDADAIFCDYAPITKKVFDKAKKLKLVAEYGVGYDNIDVEAATEAGVLVCHAPFYITNELPDHALALALTLVRKIPWANRDVRAGSFQDKWEEYLPIYNLLGRTAGVIGLGKFGKKVAKRFKAFEMRVIGSDPYVKKEDAAK